MREKKKSNDQKRAETDDDDDDDDERVISRHFLLFSFHTSLKGERKGGREDFLRDLYITQQTHADATDATRARRFAQNHHTFLHRNESLEEAF